MLSTRKNSNVQKVGGIIVLVVIIFFLFSFLCTLVINQISLVSGSYKTEGVVVQLQGKLNVSGRDRALKTETLYSPVIQYEDKDGITKIFIAALSTNPPTYGIGDKIEVIVPTNADTPRMNVFMEVWGGTLVAGGFILVFLIISTAGIRLIFKRLSPKKIVEPLKSRRF